MALNYHQPLGMLILIINFMKYKYFCLIFLGLFLVCVPIKQVLAMPIGTILYRTSGDNKMYGYNANDLIVAEKGKLAHIYSGHTAIYIGKEDGVDYLVEMQPQGAIKVPAKYFINESLGEQLVGAKIPKQATPNQIAKAVAIAKNLAEKKLAYDFDFKYQKGPLNNQWTCVGLTEKVYESANISNPANLGSLVYNANNYAVDITADGYDNQSVYNAAGDCFSSDLEFSKIEAKRNMLVPAPELIGYNVGLLRGDERFIFLPYTQYLQDSLKDVEVDIDLSSSFKETEIRGESPILALVLKWSLINNPVSAIKNISTKISGVVLALKDKIFPSGTVLAEDDSYYDFSADLATSSTAKTATVKASTTKNTTVKLASTTAKTTAKSAGAVKVSVTKATSSVGISGSANTSKTVSVSLTTPKNTTTADLKTTKSTSVNVSTTKTSSTPISTKVTTTTPVNKTVVRTTPKPTTVLATSTPAVNSVEEIVVDDDEESESEAVKPIALIAKIYSNGDDDWLEIINASDFDFDLAAAGYRLEKAKTGSDPTLIMRFGNEADGTYPGGTIIGAHSYYLIARSTASSEILAQADAIASKTTFSWTEDGYTLYLGTASISSDEDLDIVDKLGYGEALYYEKSPAPALKKGYALERKASATSTIESLAAGGLQEFWPRLYDSGDNGADFILIPYDLSVIEEELAEENGEDENNNNDDDLVSGPGLFKNPAGLNSENMTQLWHFDECYGEIAANEFQTSGQKPVDIDKSPVWGVGLWGCASSLNIASSTKAVFNEQLDLNESTINFYYRNSIENFGIILKLSNHNSNDQTAYLELTPYYSTIYGLPGQDGRADLLWPNDFKWHQFSLVINRSGGYWAMYLDGKEVYKYEYSGIVPKFATFELSSMQNDIVAIDELSFWNRALEETELRNIKLLAQPFNPYTWPAPQQKAKLVHYWDFDENTGLVAHDSAGSSSLPIKLEQWDMEGRNDSAISLTSDITSSLSSLKVSDLSMSFWWRNTNSPDEGRVRISLKNGDRPIMALVPTPYNARLIFNNIGDFVLHYEEYPIPNDDKWHHLTLTYDSYRSWLRFYLDGKLVTEKEYVKLKSGELINNIELIKESWEASIDELKIWSGTLMPEEVKADYELFK